MTAGPPVTVDYLIGLLHTCRQKKNSAHAKLLHAYMQQHQLDCHAILGNHLVPLLVDCGSLLDAQDVFERLPYRSEHSWSALISGYIDHGEPCEAFHLYQKMQEVSVQPNNYTYVALLRASASLKDVESGRSLQFRIIREGLERDLFIGSTLVDMYGKCGSLTEARHMFDKLPVRDVVSWTALISAYADHGLGEKICSCLKQMAFEGVVPDANTFVCGLKVCHSVEGTEIGQELHMEIAKLGLENNLYVSHTLIDVYGKYGSFEEARALLDRLSDRNAVPWTAMIAAYAEHGYADEALRCFQKMRVDGVTPVAATFFSSLKACAIKGDSETGQVLYIEITKRGLEVDVYVGTTLVDMYSKCGLLLEAREVFDRLPVQTAVSWNAMITGYVECGLGQDALDCMDKMQLDGTYLAAPIFTCGLKVCASLGVVETGQALHSEIVKRGWEMDFAVGNTLVDMYAKCHSLVEAQNVLDQLPAQSVFSWTAMIAGYTELGLSDHVMNSFRQMLLEGLSPDPGMFVCSLKACGNAGDSETGQVLHFEVVMRGMETELHVDTTLVNMYAKLGSLAEAQKLFSMLSAQGCSASWNTLIAGHIKLGCAQEALNCFRKMQLDGFLPMAVTYFNSLKACSILGTLETGQETHSDIIRRGFERDPEVSNMLVNMYARCGSLSEGLELFLQLQTRNTVSWAALIAGYVENGLHDDALSSFQEMQLEGISPDVCTFVNSLIACGNVGALETGREIHTEATKRALETELYLGCSQLDMYAKCGSLAEAQKVFDSLPVQNEVAWNALISGYADHGSGEEALNCFPKMQLKGVSPVAVTFACSLKACGNLGASETGKEMHVNITKLGLDRDLFVGSAMVDMYAKCGALAEAQDVFDKLHVRDVVSWNAMIKGYGENHNGKMAVQCFEDMLEQCVKPDAITYTCVFAACSHASLVLKGQEYFKLMRHKHGIKPTLDHFTCMIDLYARAGLVYEAEKFAEDMQCLFSGEILRVLLSACKIHGKVEVGLRCFQKLIEVNEDDAAAYLLMADIYASVGKWMDAEKMEELRKHAAAKKMPASVSLELNKEFYEFIVGDVRSKKVTTVLEMLNSCMRDEGYMPNLDLVLKNTLGKEKQAMSAYTMEEQYSCLMPDEANFCT